MGNGSSPNVVSGSGTPILTPTLDIPEDQKQILTEDHKSPASSAPPPNDQELKKITSDVTSLGVKLPAELLDEKGNIKADKLADAKTFIKGEADKKKNTDVGAAARLLKKAVALDPQDKDLRVEAAKTWGVWFEQSKDAKVRRVQLEEAYGFIGDIDTKNGKNPDVAKLKYTLSHRLAGICLGTFGDFEASSKWLKLAIQNATADQVKDIIQGLKDHPHPEICGDYGDPYDFVADSLCEAFRIDEGLAVLKQGSEENKNPQMKAKNLRDFHIYDQIFHPYSKGFDETSNPVVQGLYDALKKNHVTDAAFKGGDGVAKRPEEDKIWPGDVLRYVSEHFDSKEVQQALKDSKLEVPASVRKEIKAKGFGKAMADYHSAEAQKLAQSDKPEDKQMCSAHFRLAVGMDGDNAELHLKYGQALMRDKKFADAAKEFGQVRRCQPMNTAVLLDLARAQIGAEEPQKALAALELWDNSIGTFKSPQKIGEVEGLRRKAGSMQFADLLKQYDGLKGGGNRDERLTLLNQMEECPKGTNMERFEMLKRQRAHYAAEVKRYGADAIDVRHAQEDLDKIDKRIETLRDDLKQAAQVKKGEAPSAEQLDAAKTAAEISRSYGDLTDLLHYNELVKSATSDVMDTKAKLDVYGDVFRALRGQGGRTSESDAVAQQIQELAQDYLSSSKAKDYLEQVLKEGNGPVLDLLSAEGLKTIESNVDAANKALTEAGQKTDVREKRGCLIEALKHFGAIGDNAKSREVAGQIEASIPADMSRADKLQIYGLMAGVLKDSKLTPEDGKNFSLTKEYQDKGTELATQIIGTGNVGPTHGVDRVKELLVAKAFCDSIGDISNAHTATLRLSGIQGELLADPMFTDPKLANDPAKAKERLETSRLVVQIDIELLGGKVNNAAKIVQEISEGKRPASDRDLLNGDFKQIADHIEIWQNQLALAKDLPVNERLAEGTKIAASLGRLKILTQGDKPLLKPEDLSGVNGKFETTMGAIFADCMEQDPSASDADKKMAADIVSDMKSRLKTDIEDGNMIWSSQLDSKKLIQFAETAQNARKLMAEAQAKGALDPVGAQRSLQAAALYAQIGCKDRVEEALKPVRIFETGVANPADKIALDFSIAQIYTMAGMNREANGILYRAAKMNTEDYSWDVRNLATLAQGMIYLNDGDTDKARTELEKVPDNKTAQELLRGISAGGRELRINQSMQIARSWLFSLEDKHMAPEKQALLEQGVDEVLHNAKTLMLEGKAVDFRDALVKANRQAPREIQGFIQSNLISTGNDSLPNDPQGKIMAAINVMADPNVSDKDSAEAAIKLSDALILAGERYYGNAGQIAQFMVDNPYVGKDAKKIIDEKIPEWVKMGAIFSGLKGLACATPVGAFCMIFFAGSQAEANEAMVNSLISIGSFGIARGVAVGAEALWVARMATVIESPVIMAGSKFVVRTVTEAAAFPVAGALLTTAVTGKVDHWQPEHFKKEFLSMLVTFTLLHGAGIPLSKFTGRAERSVVEAQEALKLARQSGQGIEAAEGALNRAMAFSKMAKGVGWAGNVAAFTGAEYVNESLGLKPEEKGVPFWMKFLGCAVTDAQMKAGGKIIDGVTNGKLTRIEHNTAKVMQMHSELPKLSASLGAGKLPPETMISIQKRIDADPKFDPVKFLNEAQATMKVLDPALKNVPKEKQEQVRQAMLAEIAEGKLDTKLAQTLAKRLKNGQSEIVPNESGKGYDLVAGEKSKADKTKEDQRQQAAQRKAEAKAKADAKLKADQEAQAKLQEAKKKQEGQWQEAFGKGVSIEEARRGDGVLLGYRVKGAEGETAKLFLSDKGELWATAEQFKAFKTYTNEVKVKAEQARNKAEAEAKLNEGFGEGQQIVLNADTGKYELQDAKGKKLRVATDAEQKLFSDFQVKKQEHDTAISKRAETLAPEFETGVVIRPQVKKADVYEKSNADDPNAAAFQGQGGQVGYFVKVKPDGARERPTQNEVADFLSGKAPKDEIVGFEKVGSDGKVIEGPIAKDDYEAYQQWTSQKKEATKVVVLKAVKPPSAEVSDPDKTPVAVPKKGTAGADPVIALAADANRAFDLSYDHAAQGGKLVRAEDLTKIVQDTLEGLDALQPALDKLPKGQRQAVHDGILQQLADGKMSKAQALELAGKISKGELSLVPNAKAEYGYETKAIQGKAAPAGDVTIVQTVPPPKFGKGEDDPAFDPLLSNSVRFSSDLVQEGKDKGNKPEWIKRLNLVEESGSADEKAFAATVRKEAGSLSGKMREYLTLKSEAKKLPEGSPERKAADQKVEGSKAELERSLAVVQKWENLPTEFDKMHGTMNLAAQPYTARMILGRAAGKDSSYAPPKGPQILDVHIDTDPIHNKYETTLVVRNEADAQALLKEVRLDRGENSARFVADPDGRVRSVEMTTPEGKVFSVRVQLATPENRSDLTDRGGVAGASHEGIGYKEHNEDRQVVVAFENGRTVTLVIDGMGGTEGGEMAAKLAKDAFEKAVKGGKSVEEGIRAANQAVESYGKELLPALTQKLMKEKGYDKATAEHYAKYMLPGAVAMGTEVSRNVDGTYNARFRSVGDCEAAVIRFKPNGEVEILDAYGRSEADILKSRSDPNANIVDQSLGGHAGPIQIKTKDVTVNKGDIILNGSDGFFENFGSHAEIAFIIKQSGAKTPGEVRDVLMREALIRQKLADTLEKSEQPNMVLTHEAYAKAYQEVTGQEPPAGWKGMWEGKALDMMGNVGEAKDLQKVTVTYSGGQTFEFQGVPREKTQSHFKKDNTTLVVQSVGDPVRADTPVPSRADLAHEQLNLAKELAHAFGMDQNSDFMKDLNLLVTKDVASGGRALDKAGRDALTIERTKEAKALAERYGMEKNPTFMKLLAKLVVDNLRQAEIRFSTEPGKSEAVDPKLSTFMQSQRQYGLKLAKGFVGKVKPEDRMKFTMEVGKILSEDAIGLPSGGDPAVEAKFKADREARVEKLAKDFGLDGDPTFMKAAKMLMVDRVMKDCPRVEVRAPKVDPAIQEAGKQLESEIYDKALRAGRSKEEAAELAETARTHFDQAIKSGNKPQDAVAMANEKMAAEFKETVRPGAINKPPTPDQKETVRPGKKDVTPSGVRPSAGKAEENTKDIQAEVDHLAAGETPFTPAAKDFQAGKITLTEYRARQKAVAEKMVEEHKAAFDDVMGFLKELGADPNLHLSSEFPPKGRMKAVDDLAPKIVRRGWKDASPLTDVAGTRIVVRSNADVEAVIARLQEKYTIREAYTKEGEIETEPMNPADMKAKGIAEEEGVVWIQAKMDKDGIHRLVDGHRESGYRALHVVVEVDGKPVEIQIKTEAMNEWGEIEHKLVYKNKDLPPAVLDPIKQFRKEASDYLAKVTHLEPGEIAPEMPKAPELPADVPNRDEIQSGLDQMVALMKKYSDGGPGGAQVLQIPKAPKAPDGDAISRKASYEVDLYERLFPEMIGRPGVRNIDLSGELDMIRERLVEGGHQAMLDKFDADYNALKKAPQDSAEYKSAVARLGDVLGLNHGDPRFRQPVFFMDEESFAAFTKASMEIYEKSSPKEGKGADVIPLRPKKKAADSEITQKAADSLDPESLRSRIGAKGADANTVLTPLKAVQSRVQESDSQLGARMKADLDTLAKGDKESVEYNEAMERLNLIDAALRGPLEYGKDLSSKDLATMVSPLYVEKGPDSQGPKGAGGQDLTGTLATGTGLAIGLLALFSPETAHAAENVVKQAGPNIGPTEALMILGIGLLFGGTHYVRKFIKDRASKGRDGAAQALSPGNPLKVEQEGKTTTLYPAGKNDKPGSDEVATKINKQNSSVVGDKVYLSLEQAKEGSGDAKTDSGILLPVTRAEAERLGVKFDKSGNISSVPKDTMIVKPPKAETPPPIDVVGDAAPPVPVGKVEVKDPSGKPLSEIQPLQVGDAKSGSPSQAFGKIVSAEPVEGNPKKILVTVESYSPSDPMANPSTLAFGIGKQPKVIERRQFVMDREAAMQTFGLKDAVVGDALQIPLNPYVSINDSVGIADPSNPVVVRDSSTKATLLFPSDRAGKKGIEGTQIWVDPSKVSYVNGQFTVFYERGNFSTGKIEKQTEPLVLSSDQARRLGISVDHEGNVVHSPVDKDGKLKFFMGRFEVGKDDKILLEGKPFDADQGPISVRLQSGKDGLHILAQDGSEVDPSAPKGAMLSGAPELPSQLVSVAKAAGPLGVALLALFTPDTAHAASVEQITKVAETAGVSGLAVAAGIGVISMLGMSLFGRGGSKPPSPTHPAVVPTDGVTSFGVGIDNAGRPVINPMQPAMTFERGPQGQWYYYEGRPPKTFNDSRNDPQAMSGWKPVKDGDVYGITDTYGRQWVLPFQAPKDAWIPGYAPPAAIEGIVPAASGKLAVGKVSLLRMKDDGSPLVIGRGQGDLNFENPEVSRVHATIVRDPETGQHYLVDGAVGDPKKSTTGIVLNGVKMSDLPSQYQKSVPINPGDYFAINGAFFKFEPSAVQPTKAMDHSTGATALKLNGQDYSMRLINFKDTMLFGPEDIHGSIKDVHSYPNDPKGRVVLTLGVYRPGNMQAGEGKLVVELTRDQAAQMGIKLTPQGKLDPSMGQKMFTFHAIQSAPPMQQAAYAQPAPAQYGAKIQAKYNNQGFELQAYQQGMPWDAKRDLGGEVQSAERLPGDPQGRYFVKVGYREGNDPNTPVKTLLYNLTPAEAYSLGLRFDASGKLDPSRKYWLKVTPGEAPGVSPSPKVGPTPKPALVSIDPTTGLPKGVYGALGDNVPGETPRRGEMRGKQPSGTYAVRTHEGAGKDYNEDGFVQGKDFAVVIDEVGTGGSHGQASKIFGQAVSKYIEANRGTMDPKKLLVEAFRAGNDAINSSPNKRSSVVAVAQMVVKQPDGSYKAYIIHRGDARAMIVNKDGSIRHVTKDESMVEYLHGEAKEPGEYEQELKKRADPKGNVVLGALGGGHAFNEKISVWEGDLPPGSRIVMASDGITDSVSSKELAGIVTKTDDAGKAMEDGFDRGITKMSDGLDASEMLRFRSNLAKLDRGDKLEVEYQGKVVTTDRAPLMSEGELRYVRREYNAATDEYTYRVYDAPIGGTVVDQYTRKGKAPERLPVPTPEGQPRYIDADYNLWDKPTGGKMLDHYKPSDNITLHVYIHDPEGKLPPPSGSKNDGGGPPPPPPSSKGKPPAPPRPFTVTGQKKNLTGPKGDDEIKPVLTSTFDGAQGPLVAKKDGSYELTPGVLLRKNTKGQWELVETRDAAALSANSKFNIHDTQIFEADSLVKNAPVKVNGKPLKSGEVLVLQPGDRVSAVLNTFEFGVSGPKPWDSGLAKAPKATREAVLKKLNAAGTFSEIKSALAESGVPGSEDVLKDFDACLQGRVPVSVLPLALQEHMLRSMEAQSRELAARIPPGYKPALDSDKYRAGENPREKEFQTLKAAVLFSQEVEVAGSVADLRRAVENTPLRNPEGLSKEYVLSSLERFEKGEIGIQDIPSGFRQKVRDLWESKNLQLQEGGPDSGRAKDPAAEATLHNFDARANDIYAQIGRIGPVRGSAKTYSVVELRELVYEVLERGKPLEQLPTNKGIRQMVEDYMKIALADARTALRDNVDFKKNFFTGEDFKQRNFDNAKGGPDYVESLQAKYRFIRMYLNQKAGRPALGEPSPREMEVLSRFTRNQLGKNGLGKYSDYQSYIRNELGNLTPQMTAALKRADPETRALVVEAFFGASRHRQMTDVPQAMSVAAFLGKIGFHREIGVTADVSGGKLRVNVTLGELAHVSPEDSDLIFLMHTHPNDFTTGNGGSMGINQTMALGQGFATNSTLNVLFSSTDIRVYVGQAQDLYQTSQVFKDADVSAFYDRNQRVFRNWVQHSDGLSQADVILDAKGKPQAVKIRYGLYSHPDNPFAANMDHLYSAEKLRQMSRELGIPVTVERVDAATLEAQLPVGKK